MDYDLTIERDVVQYMKDSTSSESWVRRCEYVKDANNGDYPDFWYSAIILSEVMYKTTAKWGSDDKIRVGYF